MAAEVTLVVRFENPPEEQELRNLIEDRYEDAIVHDVAIEEF